MQGLTENHTLWRGLPVERSHLLLLLILVWVMWGVSGDVIYF